MGDPFDLAAGWLQEHALIPALYALGLMNWEDMSYGWALFALYGVAQVAVTFAVCLPLERWRPVERWPDSHAVWVDVAYTLLSRVGILPFVTYVLFYRAQVSATGWFADQGWVTPTLESLIPLLLGQQALTFVLYAIILDFAEYGRHRLSHQFRWWWALHSLHHAQRQMTFWSDDRNHVLDDVIAFVWFGVVAPADRCAAAAVSAFGSDAAVPRIPLARQCSTVLWLAGGASADLAPLPPRASRRAGERPEKLQLRRGAALVGHAVRHGGLHAGLRPDWRSVRRGSAGNRNMAAAAERRVAKVCPDAPSSTRASWPVAAGCTTCF